jgi:hypothetical protein
MVRVTVATIIIVIMVGIVASNCSVTLAAIIIMIMVGIVASYCSVTLVISGGPPGMAVSLFVVIG